MFRSIVGVVAVAVLFLSTATTHTASQEPAVKPAALKKPALVSVETEHFAVRYPLVFSKWVEPQALCDLVQEAMKRVESKLGAFESHIECAVTGRIVPDDPDFPAELSIAGVTFVGDDGVIHVVISLGSCTMDTWSHELLHARLRELKIRPEVWFEEGAAHSLESEDGFNEEMFELLASDGTLTKQELAEISTVTELEMRRRASGWAVIYYLTALQGKSLRDVVQLAIADLPEPAEAFDAIREQRECEQRFNKESLDDLLQALNE